MGPVLIFDKSLLQSLNPDESAWLDHFFLTNITPIFYVETLADLEKEVQSGRTPEQVVGNLAYKTPDSSSKPNVHHITLLCGELSGFGIDMRYGRPIVPGAQKVELENKKGIIVRPSPEEEAFARWEREEFLDLERTFAAKWRQGLAEINNDKLYQEARELVERKGKPKTMAQAKELADALLAERDPELLMLEGMALFGVPIEVQKNALSRWDKAGRPTLRKMFPYFNHLLAVENFFYIAVGSDLISKERASHRVDLAYLYYLPFCMVFSSYDKLHIQMVPLFLTDQQTFVAGKELKDDLAKLDAHYSELPENVLIRGLYNFAPAPPRNNDFLVTRLWNKYMNWEGMKSVEESGGPTTEQIDTVNMLHDFERNAAPTSADFVSDNSDVVIIERRVFLQKGKWRRFPPEVESAEPR